MRRMLPPHAPERPPDRLGAVYAARGVDVVRVRPFNHTGAGRPPTFVESSFARQLASIERGEQEPLLGVGNLDAVRDFLHVEDVVDAYVRLLDPSVPAGVYNVASGHGVSIAELLEMLLSVSTARPRIELDPARFRPTDASVGDAGRLQAATGWKPSAPFEMPWESCSTIGGASWRCTRPLGAVPLSQGRAEHYLLGVMLRVIDPGATACSDPIRGHIPRCIREGRA